MKSFNQDPLVQATHEQTAEWTEGAIFLLCQELGIERGETGWLDLLAPFAPVLAAMISASAASYTTGLAHEALEAREARLRRAVDAASRAAQEHSR
jgi:hypothetical protein